MTLVFQTRFAQGSTRKRVPMAIKRQKSCPDQVKVTMRNKPIYLPWASLCSPLFLAFHPSSMQPCKTPTIVNSIRLRTSQACPASCACTQQQSLSSPFSKRAVPSFHQGRPTFSASCSRCFSSCSHRTPNAGQRAPEKSSNGSPSCSPNTMT